MILEHLPSVQVMRLGGIPVHLDVSFVLVPFALFPTALVAELWRTAAVTPLVRDLALIFSIKVAGTFASILLHEAGHAMAAGALGVRATAIRIGGFYGLATMPLTPLARRGAIPILLGGPLATAATALALWLVLGMPVIDQRLGLGMRFTGEGSWLGWLGIAWLFHLNVGLLILNLMPAFPLDGGRVVRLLLRRAAGDRRAAGIVAGAGMVVGAWSVLGALGYGATLVTVGLFLVWLNYMIWSGELWAPDD